MGIQMGGAVGNLIDRATTGWWWTSSALVASGGPRVPVFNVADVP